MDLCDQVFGMLRNGAVCVGDGMGASISTGVCEVKVSASSRGQHAAVHVQTTGGARATAVSSRADEDVEVIEIVDPGSDTDVCAAKALVTIRGQKAHTTAHTTHARTVRSPGSAQKSTRSRSRGAAASEAATETRETTLPPRTSALAVWLPAERNGSWRVRREGVESSAGTHMCATIECEHALRESSASAGAAGEAARSPRYSLTLDVPWLRHPDIAEAMDPVYVHLLLPSRAHMPAQVSDSQERATAWQRARALAGDMTNVSVPCEHVISQVYPCACERDFEDRPVVRVDALHDWLQAHTDAPAIMFVVVSTVPPADTSTSTTRADSKKLVGAAAWREYGVLGLTNQGATCYLNALLQGLFHLPLLRRLVYSAPVEWADDPAASEALPEGADEDAEVTAAFKECQQLQALEAFSLHGRTAPSSTTVAELQHVFAALQRPDSQRAPGAYTVSTAALTSAFGWEKHDAWVQHDLQEMKVQLLDALTAFLKKRAPALAAAFSSLMEGAFTKRIRAPARGFVGPARIEPFTDISVPVEGFSTLKDSLRAAFRTDLTGANQYALELADGSTERVDGIAETTLRVLPPVLSLHLLRFTYDMASGTRKKITSRLAFPPVLDLEEFVDNSAPIPCQVNGDRSTADQRDSDVCHAVHSCSGKSSTARYRLTAVLAHRGVAGAGHYIAYVRRRCSPGVASQKPSAATNDEAFSAPKYASGDLTTRALAAVLSLERADQPDALSQWYLFDDTHVQRVSEQHVLDATSGGESARAGTEDTAYCLFYVREDALETVIPLQTHGAAVDQAAHIVAPNDFPPAVQQRLAVLKLQRCISSFRERKILQLKRMNGRAMIHVSTDAHLACDPWPRAAMEKYASNVAQLEVPMAQLASSLDALRYRTAFRLSVPMVSSLRDLWSAVSDALGLPSGCFRLYLVSRRSSGAIRVRDLLPGGTKGPWLPGAVESLDAMDANSKLYELPDDISQRVPVALPINAPRSTLDAARWSRALPMQPPSKRMVSTDPDGAAAQAAQFTLALTPGPVFEYQLALAAGGTDVAAAVPADTPADVLVPDVNDTDERRWSTWATADTLASDAPCVERHLFLHLSFVHARMPRLPPPAGTAQPAAACVTTPPTQSSQAMDVDAIHGLHPYFRFLAPAISRDARNAAVWQRVLLGLMCAGGETLRPSFKWRNAMPEAVQDLFMQRPSFLLDRLMNAGLTADDGPVDEMSMIPVHVFLFDEQAPMRSTETFVARPFVREGPAGFLGTVCVPTAATRGELRKLLSQWIGAQPLHALADLDAAYEERQVGRAVASSSAAVPSPPLRRTRNAATRSALHISMWALAASTLNDVTELQPKHDHILVDGGGYGDVPDLRPGEVLWVQRVSSCTSEEGTSAAPVDNRRKRLGVSRKRVDSDDFDLTDSSDDPTPPSARGFFDSPARAREWLRAQVDSVNVSVSLAHVSCLPKPGKYSAEALVYAPTQLWISASDAPGNGSQTPLFWQRLFSFIHSKLYAFLDLALASMTHEPAAAVGTIGVQARAVFDSFMQTIRGDTKRELSTHRLAHVAPLLQAPLQVRLKDNANLADVQGLLASALRARVVDTVLLGQDLILRALSEVKSAPVSGSETINERGPICVDLSDDETSEDEDVLRSFMRHRAGLLNHRPVGVDAAAGNKRRRSWKDNDSADSATRKRGRDAGPHPAATSSYMQDLERQVLAPQYRAALLSDLEALIHPRHMLLTKQTGADAFVPFQPSKNGASLIEQLADTSDAAPRAIQAAPFGQRWAWEALELRVRILDWADTPPIARIPCLSDTVLHSMHHARVHLLLDCGTSLDNASGVLSTRALEATRQIPSIRTLGGGDSLGSQSFVCRVVQLGELNASAREPQLADVQFTALLMPVCAIASSDNISAVADVLSHCVDAPLRGTDKCVALEGFLKRPAAQVYAVSRAIVRTHAVPASWPAFPSETAPPAWRGLAASFLDHAAGTSGSSARGTAARSTPDAARIRWILIAGISCHAASQAPQPPAQAPAPKMRSITSFFKAASPPASAAKPSPASQPELKVTHTPNARFPCGDVSLVPSSAADTLADVLRAHLRICGDTGTADDDVLATLLQESNLLHSSADGAIDRATQVREALRQPAWSLLPVAADEVAKPSVQPKVNVSDVIDLVDDDSELDTHRTSSTAHVGRSLLPVSKLGNLVVGAMGDPASKASTPGLQLRDTIQLGSQCASESAKLPGTEHGNVAVPCVSVPYLALGAVVQHNDTAEAVSRLLCDAVYVDAQDAGFTTWGATAIKVRGDTLAACRARALIDRRDGDDPDADVLEGKDITSPTTADGGGNTSKASSRPSSAIERGISIRKM